MEYRKNIFKGPEGVSEETVIEGSLFEVLEVLGLQQEQKKSLGNMVVTVKADTKEFDKVIERLKKINLQRQGR